jgi:hypothetical protein
LKRNMNEKWGTVELECRQMLEDGKDWEAVFSVIRQNEFRILSAVKLYRDLTGKSLFEAVDFVANSQTFADQAKNLLT